MRRVLAALLLAQLAACGSDGARPDDVAAALETKTVEAGEVTVEIDPISIDASGASFNVTLDTHSVELDMDITEGASLTIDGDPWTGARWEGDGPSGHHREGTLTFDAGGSADEEAILVLDGFPDEVEVSWDLAE